MLVKRYYAFTLAELLAVVAISALLVAFAIPAYYELSQNNATRSDSELLMSAMHTAKSAAIDRETTVSICPFNPNSDVISCQSDGNWTAWVVFQGDAVSQISSDTIISVFDVDRTSFTTNNSTSIVTFGPAGFASPGTTFSGQPETCPQGRRYRREVQVRASGAISGERVQCSVAQE